MRRLRTQDGETRTRRIFLWLPVITDTEWRWLETATIRETFGRSRGHSHGWWGSAEFVGDITAKGTP